MSVYNFSLVQGTDKSLVFVLRTILSTYCTDAFKRIKLTGYTAKLQVKKSYQDSEALLTLTPENSGLLIDFEGGSITAYFKHEDTKNLPTGKLLYDIKLHQVSENQVYRVVNGTIEVLPEVTKID